MPVDRVEPLMVGVMSGGEQVSALGSLHVFARPTASSADGLDHIQISTSHDLLTVFVRRPSARWPDGGDRHRGRPDDWLPDLLHVDALSHAGLRFDGLVYAVRWRSSSPTSSSIEVTKRSSNSANCSRSAASNGSSRRSIPIARSWATCVIVRCPAEVALAVTMRRSVEPARRSASPWRSSRVIARVAVLGIDAEGVGELAHPPTVGFAREDLERVELGLFELRTVGPQQVGPEQGARCAPPELSPRQCDATHRNVVGGADHGRAVTDLRSRPRTALCCSTWSRYHR